VDILAALEATTPPNATGQCCIARWLASFPEDAPGRDVLVATFSQVDKHGPHYRRLTDLSHLAASLDFKVSVKSIQVHRTKDCACYGRSA
jgi:hypothetical protein